MLCLNVTKEDLRKRLAEGFRDQLYYYGAGHLRSAGIATQDAANERLRPDPSIDVRLAAFHAILLRTFDGLAKETGTEGGVIFGKLKEAAAIGVEATKTALDALADELAARHADELAAMLAEPERPAKKGKG